MDGLDPASIVVPKVAVDRYKKRIKQEDIYRGQANYAKAAAAGALAGLVARFKQMPTRHRAAAGAAAGLVAEGLVRAAGRATKDSYGERSHSAKVSEQLPAALGLTLAGTLGYKRLKRAAREFSAATSAHGEVTGRGETKSEAHSDAAGKIPDNAVAGRATYMQSGMEWLCFLQWKAARGFSKGRNGETAKRRIEFSIPIRLRAKLIQAAALAGGITAADVATRATFAEEGDRKKAALHGAKEGALYGSVLAGSEPFLALGLHKIAKKFEAKRRQIFEFRAGPYYNEPYLRRSGITDESGSVRDKPRFGSYVTRKDTKLKADEDLSRQRRKLALYAGGAVLGAGALAILARGGKGASGGLGAGHLQIKPQGRGTLERLAAANALRQERGYVHLRPMMPGQRKRFDKLPIGTQAKTGRFAGLAVNPNLSPGEKQKFRKAVGKLRAEHKFSKGRNGERANGRLIEFNLTPAHLNAPKSDETMRNPFYKKPTLKRAVTSPGFKDLVKPRFKMRTVKIADLSSHQPLLEKEKVEKFTGRKTKGTLPIVHDTGDGWHIQDGNHRLAALRNIGRKAVKVKVIQTALKRRLRNAVEFARGDQLNTWIARAAISGPSLRKRIAREPFGVLHNGPLYAVGRLQHVHDDLARGKRLFVPRGSQANKTIAKILRHDYRQLKPYLSDLGFERRLRNAITSMSTGTSRITNFMYAADGGAPSGGTGITAALPSSEIKDRLKKKKRRARKEVMDDVPHKITRKPTGKAVRLEARLRNAVEFATDAPLPEWVQSRQRNTKRREHLKTAAQIAGVAGGATTVAAAVHGIISRKKAVKSLQDYLRGVGLERNWSRHAPVPNGSRASRLHEFKRREQLREGGQSEAEKGSGRFVDPISVAAGLRPAYSISTGGERRFYGGAHGGDLAITHAQVLRSAYTHGGSIRKYAHRTGNLLRDTADVAAGNPRRTDAYGRPQRREWEKPWFGRAVKDVAIGGAVLGGALALKKSPALREHVMRTGADIRRKVNRMIPDFFANWGPGVEVTGFGAGTPSSRTARGRAVSMFASVPFKFGGKIDYRRQDALYNWAKQLRREVRRKAGLPLRPAIAGSIPAKPSNVVKGFAVEFGKFVRPHIQKLDLGGMTVAGYLPASEIAATSTVASMGRQQLRNPGMQRALKHGMIAMPTHVSKEQASLSGYASPKEYKRSILRHELTHAIRDTGKPMGVSGIVADEIAAYRMMDKRTKGGSAALRGVNTAINLPYSVGSYVAQKPELRRRALLGGGVVAAGVGGAVVARKRNQSALSARFKRVHMFDEVANWAGWDVRDPRGRSARVFAPGGRKRIRREKEWHERIDNQRKLLGALAAVGTVAGAGAGFYAHGVYSRNRLVSALKKLHPPPGPRNVVPFA